MKIALTIPQVRKEVQAELRKPERPEPSRANIDAATSAVTKAMEKSIRKAQFALVSTAVTVAETSEQRTKHLLEYLGRVLPPNFFDVDEKFRKRAYRLANKIITTMLTGERLGLGTHAIAGVLHHLIEQIHQLREADKPKGKGNA